MELSDLAGHARACRESEGRFASFWASPPVQALGWPADVAEQWLYDFADCDNFQRDYRGLDLHTVKWEVEVLSADAFETLPTGPSDGNLIERFAADPAYWLRIRSAHVGVAQCWEVQGTWKRLPLLIDRQLLTPTEDGLQVVEGRTRVGVLRGRLREGAFVADTHLAWVGRRAA